MATFTGIHTRIVATKNISLNAIYNIHEELFTGEHNFLRDIQNMITHRFLKIKMFKDADGSETVKENELFNYTKQLATLVRSAIIYLLFFVDLEEEKTEKTKMGKTVPFFARAIKDEHKNY